MEISRLVEPQAFADSLSGAPGYLDTVRTALSHKKVLVLAILVSMVYLLLFVYFGGMLSKVQGPEFPGIEDFPHMELNLNPVGYMPYLAFQPTVGWYLEINLVQAGELVVIGVLVALIVALSGLVWRIRGTARQTSSWFAGVVPFFVSTGACAACTGIPALLLFIPASLAGGLIAIAQFYGLPAILTIVVMAGLMVYHLDRANRLHAQQFLFPQENHRTGVV